MVESPQVVQPHRQQAGVFRQRQRQRLRQRARHFRRLARIVVEENKAVRADVQLLGQRADVGRFRFPVQPPGREMARLQRELRVRREGFPYVGFVVLAGQAQQHAGLPLRQQKLVQRAPGTAQHHALRPVLAASPQPQRVVAIHGHGFVRRRVQRVRVPHDGRAQRREIQLRVWNPPDAIARGVVPVLNRVEPADFVLVDYLHARRFARQAQKLFARGAIRLRLRSGRAEHHDQRHVRSFRRFAHRRRQRRRIAAGKHAQVLEAHQQHVDPMPVLREHARAIQQRLHQLVERREAHLEWRLQLPPPEKQGCFDRLGGE